MLHARFVDKQSGSQTDLKVTTKGNLTNSRSYHSHEYNIGIFLAIIVTWYIAVTSHRKAVEVEFVIHARDDESAQFKVSGDIITLQGRICICICICTRRWNLRFMLDMMNVQSSK